MEQPSPSPDRNPDQPPGSTDYQVPVARVLSYAFSTTFGNLGTLLRAVAGPFLIGLVGVLLLLLLESAPVPAFVIFIGFMAFAYGFFAVNWHRFVLMGEKPSPIPRDQRRIWLFAGMGIAIGLVLAIAAALIILLLTLIIFGFIGLPSQEALENPPAWMWLLNVVAMLMLQYPMARFFLIFPAIAMGRPWSLDQAVRASAGNGVRIMLAAFFIPMLIQQVLVLGVDHLLDPVSMTALSIKLVIAIPLGAVGIAALSICYRGLVLHRESE